MIHRAIDLLIAGALVLGFFLGLILLLTSSWVQDLLGPTGKTVTVSPAVQAESGEVEKVPRDLLIVSVLPRDGIRAILKPRFVNAETTDARLRPQDQVLGVSVNGEHRAYPTGFLSRHEIVNDVVGGKPVAVTW